MELKHIHRRIQVSLKSNLWMLHLIYLLGLSYSYSQGETSELIQTNLVESGQAIRLELVISKPDGEGPFPTLVFNHGSTGTGSDPNIFKLTWWSEEIAELFNKRGWMVVFPQRRGRGQSDGLYDEGFTPNRSGYTCNPSTSLEGMERALTDIDAVVAHLKQRPEVLPSRMMIGGQSRGGILSVVYAGTRPEVFDGVINFVGGWMSDSCASPQLINTVSFRRGATYPQNTLWLYGFNDPFYSLSHSQSNFDTFIQAGGKGEFKTFSPFPGFNGHGILFTPDLWRNAMNTYIANIPQRKDLEPPIISRFESTGSSEIALAFSTSNNQRYSLLTSESLESTSTWERLGTILLGNGNLFEITLELKSPMFLKVQVH